MRVDSHQHFWRLARGDYAWLTPELEPIYADHMPDRLTPLLAASAIDKTILVQAAPTAAETTFLLEVASQTPYVAGVVGWTDLEAPDAAHTIAALAQMPKLVGIRPMIQDIPDDHWMLRSDFSPAFRSIREADLRFDALVKPRHLRPLAQLLSRHPDLPAVIDHAGKPDISSGQIDQWSEDIRILARDTNAVCKMSGLVTEAPANWTTDILRPYLDVLLEAFGPSRLMWGSDWPVVQLRCGYAQWVATTGQLLSDLSPAERAQIFGRTAASFYGIGHD